MLGKELCFHQSHLLLSQMVRQAGASKGKPCYIKGACLQTEAASIEKKISFDFKNQCCPSRLFQRQNVQPVWMGQAFWVRASVFGGLTVNRE